MKKKLLLYTVMTSLVISSCIVTAGNFQYPSLDRWNQPQSTGSIALQIQKPSFWRAPISFIGNHPYLTGTVIVLLGAKFMIERTAKEMTRLDPEIKTLKDSTKAAYDVALANQNQLNYSTLRHDFYNKKSTYRTAFLEKYKENRIKIYGDLLKILLQIK